MAQVLQSKMAREPEQLPQVRVPPPGMKQEQQAPGLRKSLQREPGLVQRVREKWLPPVQVLPAQQRQQVPQLPEVAASLQDTGLPILQRRP